MTAKEAAEKIVDLDGTDSFKLVRLAEAIIQSYGDKRVEEYKKQLRDMEARCAMLAQQIVAEFAPLIAARDKEIARLVEDIREADRELFAAMGHDMQQRWKLQWESQKSEATHDLLMNIVRGTTTEIAVLKQRVAELERDVINAYKQGKTELNKHE